MTLYSVVLNEDTLWLNGGIGYPTTSGFIRINNQSNFGPQLPLNFGRHCSTNVNDNLVVLTGGVFDNRTQNLQVNTSDNFAMVSGPDLMTKRYGHACGSFVYHDKIHIIVAGGFEDIFPHNSTEIWDLTSNSGWFQGIATIANVPNLILKKLICLQDLNYLTHVIIHL